MRWRLEVSGDAHEVYYVDADSEEEARAQFERGTCGPPEISEVAGAGIDSVEEVDE